MPCKTGFHPYNSFMLHCNIANKGQVTEQIVFLNLVFCQFNFGVSSC